MKTRGRIVMLVMTALCVCFPVKAQFGEQAWGGGVMFGWDFGMTGLKDDEARLHARAFIRHGIIDHIQAEAGFGLGGIAGSGTPAISKYSTELMPVDLRLIINPFTWQSAVPYVFGGGGFVHKRITHFPFEAPVNAKSEEWIAYVPAGVGLMANLQEHVYLDMSASYNYTFSKKLTGVASSTEDAFLTFLIGVSVSFGRQ
ncbi:MAG: hypothetical protein ACM3Q4_10045 [Acidobacteriota bacterium]